MGGHIRVGKHIWKHKANVDPKDANQCVLLPLRRGSFRSTLKHSTLRSWSIKTSEVKLSSSSMVYFSERVSNCDIFFIFYLTTVVHLVLV